MIKFIPVDKANMFHQKTLLQLCKETSYLGDLSSYSIKMNPNHITGNDYIVMDQDTIIGYLGLSESVETSVGKTSTIYYAVLKEFYGQGYGKKILNDIEILLKNNKEVDFIIATVDNENTMGLKIIESAGYQRIDELSDSDETQFHRTLK